MMTVIPDLARALRTQAPSAMLEIAHVGSDTLALLESGGLDLSFWGASPPPPPFLAAELFREHFVGLLCARHPLAGKALLGALTLDDYLSCPHVMVSFQDARQSPVDTRLAELGLKRRLGVRSPNFTANVALLPDSDFIMSLPSRLVATAQQSGLVSFKLPLDVPDYSYSIIWHRRTDSDPESQWLRGLAASHAV
jgi:DNA-binding transcriptional LysR family regulator